jgi:chemotaxis protein methyltransferase CheR
METMPTITDGEFAQFQRFIYGRAGISLPDSKKALVSGRLAKRLAAHQLSSYSQYLRLLSAGESPELQVAVDLLTTNETYFFREPKHFEFLRRLVTGKRTAGSQFRVWSAAGSTGEEAYSIAMVLEDCIPGQWEVMASDISSRVLKRARAGHYSTERISHIPPAYLQRFCLRGQDEHNGTLLVERHLRSRTRFRQINLNAPFPQIGMFDVIFLRNVLIYFNAQTKRDVVARLLTVLKPQGYLLVGHSDSMVGVSESVEMVAPAIYRKLS